MFGCAHYGADDADESPDLGVPFRSKKGGIRPSLPSPVLATIVLVFVALPLFLPDSETKGPDSTARAVFDLAADVTSVTISSNAEHLAATSRDCPIWIWAQGHKASWNQMLLPEHRPGGSRCLAVSPDGEMLAAGNLDGTISLWDPVSGKLLATLMAGKEIILGLSFSADGTVLASAGADSQVRVWDVASHRLRATLKGNCGLITALALSSDARTLVTGSEDQTVRVWDLAHPDHPAVFHSRGKAVLAVAVSADGHLVASAALCDSGVRLWDARERESRGFLRGQASTFTCLTFSSDMQTLIGGDERGCVCLWNLFKLEQKTQFAAHTGWVKCLALSSAQGTLVTGGNDGKVRVWNLAEMSKSQQPPT